MMIKQCVICLSLLVFGTATAHAEEAPLVTARHMSKWEELAVKEAKKRYPLAQVLVKQKVWDRKRKDEAVKQYHLTLREGSKEFGVFVTISFDPYSHKVNKIAILEEYQ
ncbi:YqzG/YhdC family protein [Bacillus mojavensis]|uniref:YqzG/YhdC family protein n=1 Tax=Bacillus mojavensis TaxID=72360 RepID=UPI002DBDB01C|nr:YqzG/YhdC family protein [Bacillus mojavensis]MEC1290916.1 YqzG/YhdC family protein [Bacillus mojavensis]MEC1623315.1 YqzG/YhdC family protein [Bacillus mojavensis]MEC1633538.1 YqzG/YhdC family protein [Bacillus mojavensis]MEC1658825.1 YqzG/YhdC family protein [Bacillus mojavensis]MEC1684900.1 YqzG/YhdC family protein [Bacillus mojavensis]